MRGLIRQIAEFREKYGEDVLRQARGLRGQSMPELSEELFSEFERNGNRLRYEEAYFGRRKFLSVLGLACVMERRPEDIARLEEVLMEVCGEECWALPAHVDRKNDPGWRQTIDLFAGETAQTLAQLTSILSAELSAGTTDTVKRQVLDRVLTPFMKSEPPYAGWERSGNNWNAVCCGNIGSAGLFLLEEGEERRALMERLAYALTQCYLKGFGEDGACEEGLGYWAYGLTYYALFAEQLKQVYPDMDLLAEAKMEEIARFQQKCYFSGGRTVSFSDGNCFEAYPMGLTCNLACHFDGIRFPDPTFAGGLGQDPCFRWVGVYWNLYWTDRYLEAVRTGGLPEPKALETLGDEFFSDAQWAIFRGAGGSAAAVKGGHNAESHNHNDVGSFFYLADGEAFLEDLGCGEYTKDYFSERRYTVFCNRGLSHNIPLIDGSDQREGRQYRAAGFEVPEKGTAVIRFEAAYGVEKLTKLERRLHLEEAAGELTVEDTAEAEEPVDFRENLVTRLPVTIEDGQIIIRGSGRSVRILIRGLAGGIEWKTFLHSNHQGKEEQVNVLQWRVEPGEDGVYRCCFSVVPQ